MKHMPKIIHYIWVGSTVPENIQQQIEKNNQFFGDYTVKIWTEENMPALNTFAQKAYETKKWAFVSDYLRFVILYEEGGIYLDTDMDVLKSLDDLLDYDFFSGWNRGGTDIYTGIIGASAKNPCIKNILDYYDALDGTIYPTSPQVLTECYHSVETQKELKIFESAYFYPLLDGERATEKRLENAYTNHLWHESWRSYVPLRRILRRLGIIKFYHLFKKRLKN